MSEKKFLGFIFIEGLILLILGLCVLILPKLTNLTFGVMLSSSFIAYGAYKIISSFINRFFKSNIFCEIFMGLYLITIGILLLLVPKISILWLIAFIGIYFLLSSMTTTAFISQIRNIFNFWGCKIITGSILFLIGLIIILSLPVISFWVVAILSGIGFLIKGMSKITLYLANKNNYSL